MRVAAALLIVLAGCDGGDSSEPWFELVGAGVTFEGHPADGYESTSDRVAGGVCVIDADGIPPLDLFFTGRGGGSRLFVADAPWSYRDATDERGLSDTGDAVGCLAFDADGDGDDDLLVTGVGTLRLFSREGDAFVDESATLGASVPPWATLTSAAAGDADGDGDLDLAVAGFLDRRTVGDGDCRGLPCGLDLTQAEPIANLLLARVDGGYEDATATLAPAMSEPEPTLVVAFPDVDGDGRSELFVGNDYGAAYPDRVLVADDGALRDASLRFGLAHDAAGHGVCTMGFASGDVDGDGRLDYAETTFEGFHSPVFLCGDDDFCEDRGRDLGTRAVADTFRWGNALVDLDLDGDVDLFEAAGHLYREEEGRRLGIAISHRQPPNLLTNDRGVLSRVIPARGDGLSVARSARGVAVADLDDDGRPDVVLGASEGPVTVLRNVRETDGRWLRVVLRGRSPNTGAVGARVEVSEGERVWVRRRQAGEGYLGSFDPRLLFGLPPQIERVRVRVRWPSGAETSVDDVAVDAEVEVTEP